MQNYPKTLKQHLLIFIKNMKADIFCRVVDNYGDIGVTYRLVRQLRDEFGWTIRLWVDNLNSFARLEPKVNPLRSLQNMDGIQVIEWTGAPPDLIPQDICIASFSCNLPSDYLRRLHQTRTRWINLEYLSAENWVQSCHGLPSLRSDGLSSNFFFPGFTDNTGGLLRERDLIVLRDEWLVDHEAQHDMLCALGVSDELIHRRFSSINAQRPLLISLFCYPHARIDEFVTALSLRQQESIVLIPNGVANHLETKRIGACQLVRIPFVTQPEYDKILWTADLNLVRGEDSMVRALWAGKPMIWQIYPQDEDTHLTKLDAWLKTAKLPPAAIDFFYTWNDHKNKKELTKSISYALNDDILNSWKKDMQAFSIRQAQLPDLALSLVTFCKKSAVAVQKG